MADELNAGLFNSTRRLKGSNLGSHKVDISKIEETALKQFAKDHSMSLTELKAAIELNERGGVFEGKIGALQRFVNRNKKDGSANGGLLIIRLREKIAQRVKQSIEIVSKTLPKNSAELAKIKKGRGQIRDRNIENLKNKGNFKTEILQYPMTVANKDANTGGARDGVNVGDNSEGHYIIFYINASAGPQADAGRIAKLQGAIDKGNATLKRNSTGEQTGLDGSAQSAFGSNSPTNVPSVEFGKAHANEIRTHGQLLQSGAAINSGAFANAGASIYGAFVKNSIRLQTSIALYMPNQVQTSYQLNYADNEAGALSTGLAEVFKGMSGGETSLTGGQFTRVAQGATLKALETAAPGAQNALSVATGKIMNNKMELAFKGIGRRKFNFTFTFTPHSPEEAKQIDTIVARFKFHSHPEFLTRTKGLMMTIPDTFDMHYMYQSSENSFLNKISTCFLTAINVQYGGDRYTAHTVTGNHKGLAGSPPTKTILTMEFQELETITRERISEGY